LTPSINPVLDPLADLQTRATVKLLCVWGPHRNGQIDPGDFVQHATGAMITPNDVLTAGHALFKNQAEGGRGWAKLVLAYAASDWRAGYPFRPFGEARSLALYTPVNWQTNHREFDIGIVRLDRNLGSYTGTFHFGWLDPHFFRNQIAITITHYPAQTNSGWTQFRSTGNVNGIYQTGLYPNQIITYPPSDFATQGGSSGAPVWVHNVQLNNGYWGNVPTIVAVHVRGPHTGVPVDEATRITPQLFGWIQSTINAGPRHIDRADLMDYDTWFQRSTSTISGLSATRTVHPGAALVVHASLWNGGTAAPGANLHVRFYASRDTRIDGSDVRLGPDAVLAATDPRFQQLQPFNNQQPTTVTWSGPLPNLPADRYYILWYIDPMWTLQDFNRTNNFGLLQGGPITVLAPPALPSTAVTSIEASLALPAAVMAPLPQSAAFGAGRVSGSGTGSPTSILGARQATSAATARQTAMPAAALGQPPASGPGRGRRLDSVATRASLFDVIGTGEIDSWFRVS
jgi:V8-like Glu-specific endopeptidase